MAKSVLKPPDSFPTRVDRDGVDTSRRYDMPIGKRLNSHTEWRDDRTMLPCEKPEYASDED
jgi:hypothetical protein